MAKSEAPLRELSQFLPEGTFELVEGYLLQYKVHLTVTRARVSVLGDYRNRFRDKNHRISVNGNLNTYAFLITLLHEIAHMLTFEKFGHRVQSHGAEWKKEFGLLLKIFTEKKLFPPDLQHTLSSSMHDPAASSCADQGLIRALKKYDKNGHNAVFVENIPEGKAFRIKGGRVFTRGPKRRTRYLCRENATGKDYLFSGVYEVQPHGEE